MSVLARSILFGLAFVAALVAILFGLRRRRLAPAAAGPGPFQALRKAFWAAAGVLLGAAPACDDGATPAPEVTCYARDAYEVPPDAVEADGDADRDGDDVAEEDVIPGCYVAADDAGADFGDLDAEADADAGPEAGPDVEPDAGPDDVTSDADPDATDPDGAPDGGTPPDGAGEAAVPDGDPTCYFAGPKLAGDDRRERWERRTRLRAQAVEQLLAEPGTHPAVRSVLARDLRTLRARVRRLQRG